MDGVVEIITGRERRRRWSPRDKLSLVAETNEPGATIRGVAARHGVCESLLFTWRRQVREGALTAAPEMPAFMPVRMIDGPPSTASMPSAPARRSPAPMRTKAAPGLIEIDLGDGRQVRVGSDVDKAALGRVLAALRE